MYLQQLRPNRKLLKKLNEKHWPRLVGEVGISQYRWITHRARPSWRAPDRPGAPAVRMAEDWRGIALSVAILPRQTITPIPHATASKDGVRTFAHARPRRGGLRLILRSVPELTPGPRQNRKARRAHWRFLLLLKGGPNPAPKG
jgi:hypothetical protein